MSAVYDAVEKVGSLVARIVLTPLEEMCFAYFSNAINKNSEMFMKSTVFGSTPGLSHTLAHVAIGGVLLVLVVAHIVSTDHVFQMLTHRLQKYAP
ncbi:hypothetical protein ANCDUO_08442 [Ancylostoma duodenale]|uniref:Protein RFT1 homolog n=1 Tax=Ancylostoma duodenale TaxID=51022 RepID=A0A0C2GW10_9BILA|nr:hypothetical protein ANCDUO_08442 [Ancylostoma duodenale]